MTSRWRVRVLTGDLPATREQLGVAEYWRLNPDGLSWVELMATTLRDAPRERELVDGVRRAFVRFFQDVVGQSCAPFCRFIDVGTTSPLSDIDVTVTNTRSSFVVRLAHELFEAIFLSAAPAREVDSENEQENALSYYLDVNVYSNVYYDVCKGRVVSKDLCGSIHSIHRLATQVEQVVWASVRVEMPEGSGGNGAWRTLRRSAGSLRRSLDRECVASSFVAILEHSEDLLSRLFDADEEKSAEAARAEYMRAVCVVRYLESGAYLSYGAFAHVVLILQAGRRDVRLTPLEYAASFFDNLGFLCGCERADDQAAKYLYRCLDALERFDGTATSSTSTSSSSASRYFPIAREIIRAKRDSDATSFLAAVKAFSRAKVEDLLRSLRPDVDRLALYVVASGGVGDQIGDAQLSPWCKKGRSGKGKHAAAAAVDRVLEPMGPV